MSNGLSNSSAESTAMTPELHLVGLRADSHAKAIVLYCLQAHPIAQKGTARLEQSYIAIVSLVSTTLARSTTLACKSLEQGEFASFLLSTLPSWPSMAGIHKCS